LKDLLFSAFMRTLQVEDFRFFYIAGEGWQWGLYRLSAGGGIGGCSEGRLGWLNSLFFLAASQDQNKTYEKEPAVNISHGESPEV
jgi:hypothetical protein